MNDGQLEDLFEHMIERYEAKDHKAVARALERLHQEGLIEWASDPDDEDFIKPRLTARGELFLARIGWNPMEVGLAAPDGSTRVEALGDV